MVGLPPAPRGRRRADRRDRGLPLHRARLPRPRRASRPARRVLHGPPGPGVRLPLLRHPLAAERGLRGRRHRRRGADPRARAAGRARADGSPPRARPPARAVQRARQAHPGAGHRPGPERQRAGRPIADPARRRCPPPRRGGGRAHRHHQGGGAAVALLRRGQRLRVGAAADGWLRRRRGAAAGPGGRRWGLGGRLRRRLLGLGRCRGLARGRCLLGRLVRRLGLGAAGLLRRRGRLLLLGHRGHGRGGCRRGLLGLALPAAARHRGGRAR